MSRDYINWLETLPCNRKPQNRKQWHSLLGHVRRRQRLLMIHLWMASLLLAVPAASEPKLGFSRLEHRPTHYLVVFGGGTLACERLQISAKRSRGMRLRRMGTIKQHAAAINWLRQPVVSLHATAKRRHISHGCSNWEGELRFGETRKQALQNPSERGKGSVFRGAVGLPRPQAQISSGHEADRNPF